MAVSLFLWGFGGMGSTHLFDFTTSYSYCCRRCKWCFSNSVVFQIWN